MQYKSNRTTKHSKRNNRSRFRSKKRRTYRKRKKTSTVHYYGGRKSTPEQLKQHVYLTYGTISDQGIDTFVKDVQLTESDVFYDLGSGIGNVCDRVFKKKKRLGFKNVSGLNMINNATKHLCH